MTPLELVRAFYETAVSQHRLEDLPRFIGADCVLRQGERTVPLGPAGMARHLTDLRETYPITRSASSGSTGPPPTSSPNASWRAPIWAPGPERRPPASV